MNLDDLKLMASYRNSECDVCKTTATDGKVFTKKRTLVYICSDCLAQIHGEKESF